MKIKEITLFLLIVIFLSFQTPDSIVIKNLSLEKIYFPGYEPFKELYFHLTLRILFKDDSIIFDELKNDFYKLIENNQNLIDERYKTFKELFILFLEQHKKIYKYNIDLINDDEYLKKRLYVIFYNPEFSNSLIINSRILSKSNDENIVKNLLKDSAYLDYLINLTNEFDKLPDFNHFFNEYENIFTKRIEIINIKELIEHYYNYYKITPENKEIEINFSEIYFPKKKSFMGTSDIDSYIFSECSGFYVNTTNIINISIHLLKYKDMLSYVLFHELTHFVTKEGDSGYYMHYEFPFDLSNISKLNKYISNYKNLELFSKSELGADFSSIEFCTYLNINFIETSESDIITNKTKIYLSFLKYINYLYRDYCKNNNIEAPYLKYFDYTTYKDQKVYLFNIES
ncbi:MAG TPA: hypothetical protein P5513_07680, partial [Candidatus Diapherotrites archaeon]|nr:hypothetical protein [Candidatus Diapherotrites archaeon]